MDWYKIVCFFKGHDWTAWRVHVWYGNKDMRNCRRCGKIEER
jgi:hypothetical protein